jgi:acyl-CoA dehydrogenase
MDERALLLEAVRGLITRHASLPDEEESGRIAFDQELWSELVDHGFTLVAAPELAGGGGLELEDACALSAAASESAIAAPLGETLLAASWALAEAGLAIPPERPLTIASAPGGLRLERKGGGWRVTGELARVPWGSSADCVAVVDADDDRPHIVLLPVAGSAATAGVNVAGEPRDHLKVSADLNESMVAPAPEGLDAAGLQRRGALVRAVSMVGALVHVRDLTVEFVTQRSQFGRPISKFQAVQQETAALVAEVAAASAALEWAVAAESAGPAPRAVAIAKIRIGMAATEVAKIAHQLHGAIGITDEYELHLFTRRLWAWRDEFGSETEWSIALGRAVVREASDGSLASLTQLAAT